MRSFDIRAYGFDMSVFALFICIDVWCVSCVQNAQIANAFCLKYFFYCDCDFPHDQNRLSIRSLRGRSPNAHRSLSRMIFAHYEPKKNVGIFRKGTISFLYSINMLNECVQRNSFAFSDSIFQTEKQTMKGKKREWFCKWQQMQVHVWRVSRKQQQQQRRPHKNRFHNVCPCSTIDDSDGELSFWTPAAFQLFAKTMLNEWRRNCRCTAFWVQASRQRLSEHYGCSVQLNLYLRNEFITHRIISVNLFNFHFIYEFRGK